MYTHQGFLDSRGYFVVSNANQLEWAKSNPKLVDLATVVGKIDDSIRPDNFFVPKFYETFVEKENFPVWVWRVAGWKFRTLKKGDIAVAHFTNPGDYGLVEVPVRIETIKDTRIEVSVLGTNHCVWVRTKEVRQVNT